MLSRTAGLLLRGAVHLRASARPLMRSRVAARSVHVLASFRNSWRSKALLSVWITVAAWVWLFLARRDVNIIFSVAIGVASTHSIIGSLEHGAGKKTQRMLANRLGRLCILVAAATAFVYASLIAGDWGPVDLIPHAYFGSFHLHHWAWSLGQLVAVLSVLRCETTEACLAEARKTLALCVLLAALALACQLAPDVIPGNRSFCMVVALNSALLGMLSLLLRSAEFSDRWAGLFTAISLGALLGIFANGVMSILRDFVIGSGVPKGMVFFGG